MSVRGEETLNTPSSEFIFPVNPVICSMAAVASFISAAYAEAANAVIEANVIAVISRFILVSFLLFNSPNDLLMSPENKIIEQGNTIRFCPKANGACVRECFILHVEKLLSVEENGEQIRAKFYAQRAPLTLRDFNIDAIAERPALHR